MIATLGDRMMFAPHYNFGLGRTEDRFDRFVAIAWTVSEIAMEFVGPFFWAMLGLLLAGALG